MADWNTRWPAPAKLNLMLHIVGRRADGYHLLQTVFQLLDRGDWLQFWPRDDGQISRRGGLPDVPVEDDLTVRAARILREVAAVPGGVEIELDKRLPAGGGVGGGSSDAATTLLALNHLWGCGLDVGQLAELGARLGADVPVFVRGHSAWAEGIGERLEPLKLPPHWYLIVHPGVHVATAKIFTAPDLTRDTPPTTIRDFLATGGRNDCAPLVCSSYPEVAKAMDWLGRFAPARLTGTGACVFAPFDSEAAAQQVLEQLPDCWSGLVARAVDESPMRALLGGGN